MSLRGVNPILPTPFAEDGRLDVESVERLVDFQLEVGVDGVAILGFMGEAHELSGAERRRVAETVIGRVDGRIAVWVGVRAFGTAGAVEQAREAEQLGADAVFVAPVPPGGDEGSYRHYRTVAEAVDVPVIVHDYPASFGVQLSAEVIGRLAREGHAPYVKLEDPPVLTKLSAVLEASGGAAGVFGGLGGEYFLEELERGAVGIMTGFAFPEVLVHMHRQFASGDRAAAAATFDRYVGLIRYEFQPRIGLALRKHAYWRRGVFASTRARSAGAALDERTRSEFERVIERAGLSLEPGVRTV